ncbi:MAG: aldehyde ferredoxin oxidoreductase family protein [Nitrospinae bacterium]|nr:aldehyde ferredoxin oxidoreductase family protein [Nitrospinota bacterium]
MARGGYAGKILRVDLTARELKDEVLSPQVLRQFVGGTGIGARVLYDEVPAGVEPYDPQNRLIFATGPLNGTLVPGSGTFAVVTRSPLSGFASAGHANGFFGARLKHAGYDAVVVHGCSPDWVYLYLNDGRAELRDAAWLVGKDSWETEMALREQHGQKGMDIGLSVACIGPAGENRVRFAAICSDRGHVASSGGPGAVMGSKRLKAIVAEGSRGIPVHERDLARLKGLIKGWIDSASSSPFGRAVSKGGTAGFFSAAENMGWLPVRNLTANLFPDHPSFDGASLRSTFKTKPRACHACTFAHCLLMQVTTGPYKGLVVEEPEYEGLAAWGSNVGIVDAGTALMLNDLNDRLGMDLKEATFCASLAMECYARGILNPDDTDGLDLSWGNAGAVEELLRRIARREGLGGLLAEGVMRSSQRIGNGAQELAVYAKKGFAPHVHDPRGRWSILFGQAVSNMGSIEGSSLELSAAPDLGFPEPIPFFSKEMVPKAQARTGPKRQFEDTLGICMFLCQGSLQGMVDTLNAVTGYDLDKARALEVGERIINLLRLFNVRHGLTPDDDSLSPRLREAIPEGAHRGRSIDSVFEEMRRAYYAEMGWDPETGRPLPQTLQRLGLEG